MTIEEADEMLDQIEDMALLIEEDKELKKVDPRYSILATWIDTDLNTVHI